ncbi:hypothetical protein [Tenacibaculum aquimarinum]|uniref:hypothetical protein n=1 Tax=Tenacibaculum aquimarinum TaxID=2910675 RepID=UPI001F0A532B|nr:hypothetical protein [Tenacibaculum aquimarinum]MCH3884393.1 hypothetical protein [Tenacibaculum aquimarinum]
MRKIKITENLKKEVKEFNDKLFTKTRSKGFKLPTQKLRSLLNNIKPRFKDHKKYIQNIINKYDEILNAEPIKMQLLIAEFNLILPLSKMKDKVFGNEFKFNESVINAMRYEDMRSKEFPEYLLNSNLKTCVYCNAQSTLTIEPLYYSKKKKKEKSNFKITIRSFPSKIILPLSFYFSF